MRLPGYKLTGRLSSLEADLMVARRGNRYLFLSADTRRERYLDELRRWAATHNGLAPRIADWNADSDPAGHWPRASSVAYYLGGWSAAVKAAGLSVRHGSDGAATSAQHIGRNRQMVTGGALGAKRHGPGGGYA